MCNDQKQLSRKIRTMEDELLRTRIITKRNN